MSASEFWLEAHAQAKRRGLRHADDAAEEAFWIDHAPGYDQKSPLAECAVELIDDLRALARGHTHLLEIGAGPGAFTRRLASEVSRITVIEPSAAMRAEFQALWDGAAIVETLPSKWEEAPHIGADIVFGANAFYRIEDIAPALLQMVDSARHRVALVQTVGRPHANPLSVTFNGETHEWERADALCGVLAEMSIEFRRRDYDVRRPDGPSRAALIDWATRP
ncbi:MAG: methyltransferase domain-containing protein [Pseudomonadota bacterium]